jgi:hypothetical protein
MSSTIDSASGRWLGEAFEFSVRDARPRGQVGMAILRGIVGVWRPGSVLTFGEW